MKDDTISRQAAIDALGKEKPTPFVSKDGSVDPFGAGRQNQWYRDGIAIMNLPSAQPEIIRCKDCKHNPKHEWFGCPMSHLSEAQRPETAWCWKAERRTDD